MLRSNYLNVRKLYEGFNLRRLLRVMLHRRHGRASPPTTSVPNPLHSIISVRRLVGLTGLEVEDDYDGMRLDNGITREFIDDMITRFKNNKRLHKKYVPSLFVEEVDFRSTGYCGISRIFLCRNLRWSKSVSKEQIPSRSAVTLMVPTPPWPPPSSPSPFLFPSTFSLVFPFSTRHRTYNR